MRSCYSYQTIHIHPTLTPLISISCSYRLFQIFVSQRQQAIITALSFIKHIVYFSPYDKGHNAMITIIFCVLKKRVHSRIGQYVRPAGR